MTEVHGLPEPPDGCECSIASPVNGQEYFDRDRHEWRTWDHQSPSPYNEIVARPIAKPWSPPDWAKGLGWMTQNCLGDVWFSSTQPVLSFGGTVYVGTRHGDNGSMSIKTAKALNLYPPDWDTKPASERCLKLGGE